MNEEREAYYWTSEWGGFRNYFGVSVILRRWRISNFTMHASPTGDYHMLFAPMYFIGLLRVLRDRRAGAKIPKAVVVDRNDRDTWM